MPPLRHELKYWISYGEYAHLSRTLDYVLARDPAGDEYNEYHVRSLYFDTIFDDFLLEKIAGIGQRQKIRIRIYNHKDDNIRLEKKEKFGDLISKTALRIPRDLAEQLIGCDPTGLSATRVPLLGEVYRLMKTRLLKPVVIVDYMREAYVHPAEEVRITFDKKIHTGLYRTDLFEKHIPTVPCSDENLIVLEIKFNRVLPDYLQSILSGVTARHEAVSKYVLARRFEGKEF